MENAKSKHGGSRPGAGRKPSPAKTDAQKIAEDESTLLMGEVPADIAPLDFLEAMMRNPSIPDALRAKCATTAAQYRHTKRADGGKKDEEKEKAEKVAGKFAVGGAPKLKAVG